MLNRETCYLFYCITRRAPFTHKQITIIIISRPDPRFSWQDVDLKQNRIYVKNACVRGHLKGTKTKSGLREVMLQPQAREALLNQQTYTVKQNEIVFHDSRTNMPWKNDQPIRKTVWTPALKRAGIKYRNPYQTRHTFASTLLSRGENPLWVAQQMGHKDWGQIRKVYGRWIPQSAR